MHDHVRSWKRSQAKILLSSDSHDDHIIPLSTRDGNYAMQSSVLPNFIEFVICFVSHLLMKNFCSETMAKHSSDTRTESLKTSDSFEYNFSRIVCTLTSHCTLNNEFEMTKSNLWMKQRINSRLDYVMIASGIRFNKKVSCAALHSWIPYSPTLPRTVCIVFSFSYAHTFHY